MAQFVRPTSDIATGGWSSTPLWSKVDEGSPGDDTTIVSDNNTAPDNADFGCSDATDPSSSTNHILRAAWNKDASGGHAINAVLELWQGTPGTGTLIATLSVTGIGDVEQEDSYTLSAAEADAITDYAALNLRLSRQGDTGGSPTGRRALVAEFVELEVPDAGPSGQTLTPTHFSDADSFGAHTVSPGTVTLSPTPFTDADTFGAHNVDLGLSATLFIDADSFGSPQVHLVLAASLFADADSFGSHTVTADQTLDATLYTDPDSFGAHTVSTEGGSQTLTASLFTDADSFGSHQLDLTLVHTAFADPDTIHVPTVTVGAVTLSVALFTDPDTFGAHTLEGGESGETAKWLFPRGSMARRKRRFVVK